MLIVAGDSTLELLRQLLLLGQWLFMDVNCSRWQYTGTITVSPETEQGEFRSIIYELLYLSQVVSSDLSVGQSGSS
jgi:hypothetical protein